MKTILNKNDKLAKHIIREVKKRHPEFLKHMEKMEPIIRKITTIKPEKGLRPFIKCAI